MLTLTHPLTVTVGDESYTVYRDDTNLETPVERGERRRLRFYLVPDKPRVALDLDGKPVFSLIVYRQDEQRLSPETAGSATQDVGGGILTFTVDLAVAGERFDRIRERLSQTITGETLGEGEVEVELTYVPFLDGTVAIAVAGETGAAGEEGREFVKSVVGGGKVAGVGANRKAVMVKLTQSGAALMSQLEDLRTLPINVQYDLSFEHRLLGVTMRVWCDVTSSFDLVQTLHHETTDEWGGYLSLSRDRGRIDKVTSVTETLIRSKTAGVEVTPGTSAVDEETLLALEKFGLDQLARELDKALEAAPPPDDLDRRWLEEFHQSYGNHFNFTLDRKMVLVQRFTPSANLDNVFQRADFEELVAFVDLRTDFFSFLKIPIRVNADFTRLPVDSVTVTVHYRRERVGGSGHEEVSDSFNFTDGASIKTFLCFANRLRDVTYDWTATVHYKGSDRTYVLRKTAVRDDFLVVDVGQLGMIDVDLGLGLVDLAKFPQAKVSCRYRSGALGRTLEKDFLLSEDNPSALWTEVIHEPWDGRYELKVDWRKADGEILPGAWKTVTGSRVKVDAPIPDQLQVAVVCTGNFKDGDDAIAQVAVSLRYRDPANAYSEEGRIVFTADNQQQTWTVDLRNREKRDYEYRYTLVYKDGMVRSVPEAADAWLPGQPGFIAVGERYTLEVDVYPMLLTYPDHAKVVQVDLAYADPSHGVDERDSFVFSDVQKTPQVWRVRGAEGGPKDYSYTVTYISAMGEARVVGPVVQDAEAIVVRPAPAPAPPPAPPVPPGG